MKDCRITLCELEKVLGTPLTQFDPSRKNPDHSLVISGYAVPVAPSMQTIRDEDILYPEAWDNRWKLPCESILTRVIITARKELAICCGMVPTRRVKEVVHGSLDDSSLEELLLRAHDDLLANWLALEGPFGIMQFIKAKDSSVRFRDRYVSTCHLCCEILTREDCRLILHRHAGEKAVELGLKRELYQVARHGAPICT